jgi:putative aldouronate transport system substrate-binding protein
MLQNFGVEGESYIMFDGYPKFTELLTNNPNGKSFSEMGRMYTRSFTTGPFIQDTKYGEQFFGLDIQHKALAQWSYYAADAEKANQTFRGKLSVDELSQITTRLNDITTFVSEQFAMFLIGTRPLSEFDSYMEELKKMGIEEIISVHQNAQDRFMEKYPDQLNTVDTDISNELFWQD